MENCLLVALLMVSASSLAPSTASAQQQTQSSSQTQKQAPKKPKVWTDDDVTSLRSPADAYAQAEQKQKDAEGTATNEAAGAQTVNPSANLPVPKTVREADGFIAEKKQAIDSEQAYVNSAKKDLENPSMPDKERQRLQWRVQARSQYVDKMKSDMAALQAQRDALAKKDAAGGSAPPSNN